MARPRYPPAGGCLALAARQKGILVLQYRCVVLNQLRGPVTSRLMATLSPISGADWDVRVGALVVLRRLPVTQHFLHLHTGWMASKSEGWHGDLLSHQKLHSSWPAAVQLVSQAGEADAAEPRKAMTSQLGLQGRAWDGMAPSRLMADVRVFAGSILASALAISFPRSAVFCSESVSSKCLLHRGVQQAHAGVT